MDNIDYYSNFFSGSNYYPQTYLSTGTYRVLGDSMFSVDDDMLDQLMGRLMVPTSKVITPCKWCGSHNAFSNPTCVKCGGPLG